MYNKHTHNYLREISTEPPDEVTEFLNEMDTTNESIAGTSVEDITDITGITDTTVITDITVTTEATSGPMVILDETSPMIELTTTSSTMELTTSIPSTMSPDAPTESSQTVLIVLGLLLAVLVIVCCVLACILAKIRRKGFCTVEGKNQETCDEDCPENGVTLEQSPKASMSSGKSETSRSLDKLLTK